MVNKYYYYVKVIFVFTARCYV